TTFELLVGLGMEKMFGARWWDYSHEKFNYRGYICPKVSILWGLGCVVVVRIVHPTIEKIIELIPIKLGLGLIVLWSVLIVIDLTSSICAVNKLNNRLKQIDEISKVMLLSAVKIGGNLADKTLETKEKYDRFMEAADARTQRWKEKYEQIVSSKDGESRLAEIKQKYGKIVDAADFKFSDWKEKYEKLVSSRDSSVERLLKAFPQLHSISYSDSMEALKKRLSGRRGKNIPDDEDTDIIDE
ncbi:MAG: putative ABC transporter permease, partial [Oscillospiraceae bacterium]|nr:putative ABC transporter permease [Oscillospiraceae bacterium]